MLKKLMISAAVAALTLSSAFAQASPPASPPEHSAPGAASSPKFVPAQGTDKWVFSKFKGTQVIGPDNVSIGSVTDILFDKSGKVDALIVGVGGFLGIGEKSVAIDMNAFQVAPPETTGSSASANNDPTSVRLKVSWTKEQLKQAPDFAYYKPPARQTSAPSPTTGAGGQRPSSPMGR